MKRGSQRGRGRLLKRPDSPYWWIAYCVDGKEVRESAKTEKHGEALALLQARLRERDEGKLVATPNVTIRELLQDLQDDFDVRELASARTLRSHVTDLFDAQPMNGAVVYGKHGLAEVVAAKLTTARWNRLVKHWKGQGARPATINRRRTSLLQAYHLAAESQPPKVARIPKLPKLDEHNVRTGFFEKADLHAVLAHVAEEGVRDFIEWGFWTGMRKGETSKLTWAMLDRETWTLTIPAEITKNRKGRPIPLVGPLRAIVERRLKVRRLDCPSLFWRLHTGAPTKRLRQGDPTRIHEFRKAWNTACKKAGLDGKLYHDLRRTGVRNLTKAGVARNVAMKISGHKTESVFERYNIDTDDDVRDAVEKLATYVDTLPTDRKVIPITDRKATA